MLTLPSSAVAWWGAAVSSVLAVTKLWEVWRDKFRVEVSGNLVSLPDIGNTVLIRNLSNRSFILSHWELLYGSGRWPFRKLSRVDSSDYDEGDRKVDQFETHTLNFADERYFDWGVDALKGRSIYIRLWIAGRRPRLKLLYASS